VVVLWGGGEVSYHCVFIIIMYYYLARSEQDTIWKFQQTTDAFTESSHIAVLHHDLGGLNEARLEMQPRCLDWKSKANEKDEPLRTKTSVLQLCKKSTQQDLSKPSLPVGSSQPIEPNPSHLREALVVGVQVVAQICRGIERAHVHYADPLACIGSLGNNT
jgi:hypothetical protein